ncbi:hypothetical protein [Streptomyces sp. UNOB3_S3]|nr:hypothetical protein [Streptomyces sp. UNOB3_S3]MCC3774013.1 hypothetical protein [Streptomyces sp. UNOB3_S3]
MGHEEDQAISCDREGCNGTKSVVYEYDDWGNCTSQTAYACNECGNQ